jgi:uncharacterized protein
VAATSARFAEGIRLFNQGNFFDAHDLWEQEWKIAEGEEKLFYQGIIQAAAALLHVQRGNYAGALSVYLKSWPKLARFPAVWMGIELGQFRCELRRYFAPLRYSSDAPSRSYQRAVAEQVAGSARPPAINRAPED